MAKSVGEFRAPFLMGEDFDFILRLGELGALENLPTVLYKYRINYQSRSVRLGEQWPEYFRLISSLADERAVSGSDTLQRGEIFSINGPMIPEKIAPENRNEQYIHVRFHLRLFAMALKNRNYRAAMKQAISAVSINSMDLSTWWKILKTTIRWMTGRLG